MYSVINSQSDLSTLVSLAEAKRQCRIDPSFTIDDEELQSLITASAELAQNYTRKLLTPGEVTVELDEYVSEVLLPFGNATAVTEVLLDNEATTDFTFSPITQKLKLTSTIGFSNLKVTYNCGYSTLPDRAKQGILVMINTMYNHREDVATGTTVESLPMASIRLLNSIKNYRV